MPPFATNNDIEPIHIPRGFFMPGMRFTGEPVNTDRITRNETEPQNNTEEKVVELKEVRRPGDPRLYYEITLDIGGRRHNSWGLFENREEAQMMYEQIVIAEEQRATRKPISPDSQARIRIDLRPRTNQSRRSGRPMGRDIRRMYHRPKEDNENEFTINEEAIADAEVLSQTPGLAQEEIRSRYDLDWPEFDVVRFDLDENA